MEFDVETRRALRELLGEELWTLPEEEHEQERSSKGKQHLEEGRGGRKGKGRGGRGLGEGSELQEGRGAEKVFDKEVEGTPGLKILRGGDRGKLKRRARFGRRNRT